MTTQNAQPEALRLAEWLDSTSMDRRSLKTRGEAAAELRRLHEEVTELRHAAGVANMTIQRQAQRIEELEQEASGQYMTGYEVARSEFQQRIQELEAQLAQPEQKAKDVIDAARAAMDASTEAEDGDGGILIASELAASLSLCLDEYDRAIEAAHGIKE